MSERGDLTELSQVVAFWREWCDQQYFAMAVSDFTEKIAQKFALAFHQSTLEIQGNAPGQTFEGTVAELAEKYVKRVGRRAPVFKDLVDFGTELTALRKGWTLVEDSVLERLKNEAQIVELSLKNWRYGCFVGEWNEEAATRLRHEGEAIARELFQAVQALAKERGLEYVKLDATAPVERLKGEARTAAELLQDVSDIAQYLRDGEQGMALDACYEILQSAELTEKAEARTEKADGRIQRFEDKQAQETLGNIFFNDSKLNWTAIINRATQLQDKYTAEQTDKAEAAPERLNVNPAWTEKEIAVIGQLALRQDISPAKVIQQALRLYQLHIEKPPILPDKFQPTERPSSGTATQPVSAEQLARKMVEFDGEMPKGLSEAQKVGFYIRDAALALRALAALQSGSPPKEPVDLAKLARKWYEAMKADDAHHFAEHEQDDGGDFPTTHLEYTFEQFRESPIVKRGLALLTEELGKEGR